MAALPPGREHPARAPARPGGIVSAEAALAEIFAPLAFGESPRVGILGDSGTGKTEAARRLVAAYLARSPGVALVIDDKELRTRFSPAQEYRDVAAIAARRPAPEPRVLVFRGDVRAGVQVDAGAVAELAWAMAARRRLTLIVYDELSRAADWGQWRKGCERVPAAFGQGRAIGISSLWSTQSPQDVPREAFEQSSVICCFRLAGQGLRLLSKRDYVDAASAAAIAALPGDELPPAQRGHFVLLRRGRPWDGQIYRFVGG